MEATAPEALIEDGFAQREALLRQQRSHLYADLLDLLQRRQRLLNRMLSELAKHEAAIAAGTPLPVPPRFRPITSQERKRLLAKGRDSKKRSMDFVEYLKGAVPRNKKILAKLGEQSVQDLQGLMPLAWKELDAADCAEAAARSTTLPRAMGEEG
ncbi:hypothetical protein V502_07157 [Pseudogymnoascus sp. VKM F-4520 (FW-2644)]|nr:hypothetical protein V502_07157 [Pseudogymnoascus sp. VKM F-4520 (FW-2644)]